MNLTIKSYSLIKTRIVFKNYDPLFCNVTEINTIKTLRRFYFIYRCIHIFVFIYWIHVSDAYVLVFLYR